MIENRVSQLERIESRMLKKIDKTRREAEMIMKVKHDSVERFEKKKRDKIRHE